MAAIIEKIFDLKTYLVTLRDDIDGEQMAVIGVMPTAKRAVVIVRDKMSAAQAGTSKFATLPKPLEEQFLKRVGIQVDVSKPAAKPEDGGKAGRVIDLPEGDDGDGIDAG